MGHDVGDGRLASTAGDQQPRVALQQQPFVARGEAPTGVVLAECRGHPDDVRPLCPDSGRDVVERDPQLHVHQLHLPAEGGAGGPG